MSYSRQWYAQLGIHFSLSVTTSQCSIHFFTSLVVGAFKQKVKYAVHFIRVYLKCVEMWVVGNLQLWSFKNPPELVKRAA